MFDNCCTDEVHDLRIGDHCFQSNGKAPLITNAKIRKRELISGEIIKLNVLIFVSSMFPDLTPLVIYLWGL